jgi:hypothetical protein
MRTLLDGAEVWRLKAESGLPLDMSLAAMWQRGAMPTWPRLLDAARRDGANLTTLVRALLEDARTIYPEAVYRVLCEKLPPLAAAVAADTLDARLLAPH